MTDRHEELRASLKAAVDVALMFGKPSIECDTSGLRAILSERDALAAEVNKLREYARAGADDYSAMCAILRASENADLFPKAIRDMADTASLLTRAAAGDEVFAEYQSEVSRIKSQRDALAERVRVLEGARAELYRLGFQASGEGWNGEWPFEGVNLETSPVEHARSWRKKRDDDIAPSPLVEGGR